MKIGQHQETKKQDETNLVFEIQTIAKSCNWAQGKVFSRVLRDSTPRFVGRSVGPSVRRTVGPSVTLYFFGVNGVFGLTAPAQMLY